jgi:site-specific recombinase XerD
VEEGEIGASPMLRVPVPVDRTDQIRPFTEEQQRALLKAAKRSHIIPKRDVAIVSLLIDTGIRASELCGLDVADFDVQAGQVFVREGKGGKGRSVPVGPSARRALYDYLSTRLLSEDDEPLFLAERGVTAGDRLTRKGLQLAITRIGRRAGVEETHAHRFRHTFAISFLRGGGNVFTLQQMFGHTSLSVTSRYIALAQADIRSKA